VEEHRRYPEEPDPAWFPGRPSYDPVTGGDSRGDDERRVPEQRSAPPVEPRHPLMGGVDSLAPAEPLSPAEPYRQNESFGPAHPGTYSAMPPPGSGGSFPGGVYPANDPLTGALPGQERPSNDAITFRLRPGERPAATANPPDAAAAEGYGADPTSVIPSAAAGEGARFPTGQPDRHGVTGDGVYRTRRPALVALFGVVGVVVGIPALRLFASVAFADKPSAQGIIAGSLLVLGLPLVGVGLYSFASGGRGLDRAAWLRPPLGYLTIGLVLLVAAGLAAG
jgi:hypothetical protein